VGHFSPHASICLFEYTFHSTCNGESKPTYSEKYLLTSRVKTGVQITHTPLTGQRSSSTQHCPPEACLGTGQALRDQKKRTPFGDALLEEFSRASFALPRKNTAFVQVRSERQIRQCSNVLRALAALSSQLKDGKLKRIVVEICGTASVCTSFYVFLRKTKRSGTQ